MPVIRKREVENLQNFSEEELKSFLENLPIDPKKLEQLFEYLEEQLKKKPCSHVLFNSMQFMLQNRLDFARVTKWLNANGAFCDCKVLEYIASEWRKVFEK
ncbi:MAG: DUF2695 domain-containing protein [Pyrinomonadaceae bacterium]|nr:DUF2695 domain-containing protein [Pyrinomonadaceae bacterium]MCX7639171.1 DUF2695 domain-containing protein [Pyrinomonadaceae bacterium]MDW8303608.1 DUF2695 domain-containing protein [Acidobacteriota bacterium]